MASADAARAVPARAAEPAAAAAAATEPARVTSPMESLSQHWGKVDFTGTDTRSVRIREMLIPEQVRDAAKALIDAIETIRTERVVSIVIGAGDRAWPKGIPQNVENAEHLRLALRRELERRGHRFTAGTPAAGVWQLGPLTGRDTIGWRFRLTAPKASAAAK
jgi:hypothetical protein